MKITLVKTALNSYKNKTKTKLITAKALYEKQTKAKFHRKDKKMISKCISGQYTNENPKSKAENTAKQLYQQSGKKHNHNSIPPIVR